jgi:cell division FtsZ-interacting protein ZapD
VILLPLDEDQMARAHLACTLREAVAHANRALVEAEAVGHAVADNVLIAVVRLTHAASVLEQRRGGR